MERNDMNVEYVEALVPDKMKLAMYVNRAKGLERTMAQFADACGVSASTLSRIVNHKITKPLSTELIQAIVKNSADPEQVEYEWVMRANGMVPKERHEQRSYMGDNYMERREAQMNAEIVIKNTIADELYARNHMIQFFQRLPVRELPSSKFALGQYSAFAIRIQGYEPMYWNFVVNVTSFQGDDEERIRRDRSMFIRRSMDRYSSIFLRDAWEPEIMKDIKTSFVFVDSEAFQMFSDLILQAQVNTEMSIILIDTDNQKVVTEKMIPRKEGSSASSIFDEEIKEVDDDDFEMWSDPDDKID